MAAPEDEVTRRNRSKRCLAVFTWAINPGVLELTPLLDTSVSVYYISCIKEEWKSRVDGCSAIILCEPYTPETPPSHLKEFLDYCKDKCENIKVVITDVEDINSERKITDWWMSEKYSDYELLTLSKAEIRFLTDHHIDLLSAERKMANKVRHMHRILQEAAEKNLERELQKIKRHRLVVGIFSRSNKNYYSWLTDLLCSENFKDTVSHVKNFNLHKELSQEFNSDPCLCTFGIMYCTNREQKNNVTYVELILLYSGLGKDNMIIVMDGVEDSSDQEKIRILRHQPNMDKWRHNLFLISHKENSSKYQNFLSSLLRINKPHVTKTVQETSYPNHKNVIISDKPQRKKKFTLGIFSRSSKEESSWLEEMLKPRFTVKSFYIANNRFRQFMEEVSQCQFGILYHSKNRGRINVTDVTDSLYDNELEHMSTILGKEKVWVLIDDLDHNSEAEKKEILRNQPKIQNLAKDLYLIKHGTSEQKVRDLEHNKHLFI